MPNKIGRVGRKKMNESDKKIRIDSWVVNADVELLGGKKAVEMLFCEFFKNKVDSLKTLKPVNYND